MFERGHFSSILLACFVLFSYPPLNFSYFIAKLLSVVRSYDIILHFGQVLCCLMFYVIPVVQYLIVMFRSSVIVHENNVEGSCRDQREGKRE